MTGHETPLPGPMLDLLTDGVDLTDGGRGAVIQAVRSVMLSAHRHGIGWPTAHALLTDTASRRLARQVAHGKGGRRIAPATRNDLLKRLWADTGRLAAARPAWTPEVVEDLVDRVRDTVEGSDLTGHDLAVMLAVLDLAAQHRTTRVAAPVRTVAERSGLTVPTAHRVLMRLCESGWLRLAKRGDRRSRRSNLYAIAPGVISDLEDVSGASPPTSQTPPMSHQPTSHLGADPMDALMLNLTAADRAAVLALLADRAAAAVAADVPPPAHLRVVRESAGDSR